MSFPTIKALLDVLHECTATSTPDELAQAIKLIQHTQALDDSEHDTLRAAFLKGPLDDGDVPSKSGRDKLLQLGFVAKVVVRGEEGYNACTYLGARAYRLIQAGAIPHAAPAMDSPAAIDALAQLLNDARGSVGRAVGNLELARQILLFIQSRRWD